VHGDVELELLALANALYNLGTTAINDNSKEKNIGGGQDGMRPDKKMGAKVNQVVEHLAAVEELSQQIDTMIPMQILAEIDNGRNPMQLSRDRIERAALENQFMHGKMHAIETYTQLLDKALCENFPELTSYLQPEEKGKEKETDGTSEEMTSPNEVSEMIALNGVHENEVPVQQNPSQSTS